MRQPRTLEICVLVALCSAVSTTTSAQALEEVVVTAQRREQSIQNVPIAVTAVSAENLKRVAVDETLAIARITPNFRSWNNVGLGTANSYAIRGLHNTESIATFDPPVGTYIDDFFIQRQNANNYALFDFDRIEVLRGPQGVLFGRNTTGGAVRVILNKPAEEFGGFAELGTGNHERKTARASVDIPLASSFHTKLSAFWVDDDGYVDNVTTGERGLNFEDSVGVRGAFEWLFTDRLSWEVSASFIDTEHAGMFNFKEGDDRFTATGLVQGTTPYSLLLANDKARFGLGNEVESMHYTSNFAWETGIGTLNLLTAYYDLEQRFLLDFFEGPFPTGGFVIANEGRHEQFTQEIKLTGAVNGGAVGYTAGVFYFDEDNETDFAQIFNLGILGLGLPDGIPLIQYDRTMTNGTKSWAAYTQVDWHVTDAWTLTGGVRYTDEEDTIGVADNGNPLSVSTVGSGDIAAAGVPLKQSKTIATPRLAVQYQPSDQLMFYASATKGFKSGGWNARGGAADSFQPFTVETLWNYEIGARSQWFDDRVRLNLTGFFMDVTDFQIPSGFASSAGITFITLNFAGMESKGLELEATALLGDRLTVFANVGVADAKYSDVAPEVLEQQALCRQTGQQCAQGIVTADGEIADPTLVPEYQVALGAWYVVPLTGSMNLVPSVSFTRYGEQSLGAAPADLGQGDSYSLWAASLSLENVDSDWSLALACGNCTDRTHVVGTLGGLAWLPEPMRWTLAFRKGF